ncbi:efflux RND transporter periplasmic adaptor subunit [Taibaiella lutea]|uniref:Efflux RND transporter periplasmic adaptor subunit n=1 Tax=Taibaiella lutea TaxID=2608001 RepID=A0A5M6CQH4_9BACT|nr:efflux RND transporter periplasmic adaptor subunit [Taibaiella lutea]KAA5537196.1 efflux RND transporter periplasmic adaptor subunit [Taibaiella lutea]
MKKALIILPTVALALGLLSSCGGNDLKKKKADLEKLQEEQSSLSDKITKLQDEIAKLDPSTVVSAKTKLVSVETIGTETFNHYIDLQGKIDALNTANVAPRGQGGVVTAVMVKQGDPVKQGQLLLKLESSTQNQNVIAMQQQVNGAKAQLDQAQSVYKRQQNLWSQNIGTELQVLNAKTSVEAMQSQYNAALANLKIAQEQLGFANIHAPISGVANIVNVKIGEVFTGGNQVQIVSNSDLKVTVNVPENYLEQIKVGSDLKVTLPEAGNKVINTKVNVTGKLIDPVNRSFYVEGKIPVDQSVRPNQIAKVSIRDYTAPDAITIPVNTIQNDEKGKYIMVASNEKGKWFARKRQITIGELYSDRLEVKSGLKIGDIVIVNGFQNLYEGQPIIIDSGK